MVEGVHISKFYIIMCHITSAHHSFSYLAMWKKILGVEASILVPYWHKVHTSFKSYNHLLAMPQLQRQLASTYIQCIRHF